MTPFHALHARGAPLLRLPNAWDVASALLFERAGAPAVATTSAGVAWAHGFADGEHLPLADLVTAVARITRAVRVPVTVDLERGYGDPALAVARVVAAGVAGVNLEDAAGPADPFARALAAVRAAEPGVFVNARTCVALYRSVPPERLVAEILARARRYADAGADGLFVPGLIDAAAIEAVARGTPLPLNVLALPGLPDAAELARLGVRRLSVGMSLFATAYGAAASAWAEVTGGEAPAMSYRALDALFS